MSQVSSVKLGDTEEERQETIKQIGAAIKAVNFAIESNGNALPAEMEAVPTVRALAVGKASALQQQVALGVIVKLDSALKKLPAELVNILMDPDHAGPIVVAGNERMARKMMPEILQQLARQAGADMDAGMDDEGFGKTWNVPEKAGSKPN